MRKQARRDVEPGEVQRYLRQELLMKVGLSDWDNPRLYCYDLAKELEPTPSVRSVVVIPSDPDQPVASQDQEPSPPDVGPDGRRVMAGLISSPVTSLPCTPGRDIHLTVESEESPRSGRDEWRRRRWNKRWAAKQIGPG